MFVTETVLKMNLTDKKTGENWAGSYEDTYIENLTQRTGNFKKFEIFVHMLKSGILKTSNSIYLDILTFDELDDIRNKKHRSKRSSFYQPQRNAQRRYFILTYLVEFDRIHYPLPLEYFGMPDPTVLQGHIHKLENDVACLTEKLKRNRCENDAVGQLKQRIQSLSITSKKLYKENQQLRTRLTKKPANQISLLEKAIKKLEASVIIERETHRKVVQQLKRDKVSLNKRILNLAKDFETNLKIQLTYFILSNCKQKGATKKDNYAVHFRPRSKSDDFRYKSETRLLNGAVSRNKRNRSLTSVDARQKNKGAAPQKMIKTAFSKEPNKQNFHKSPRNRQRTF